MCYYHAHFSEEETETRKFLSGSGRAWSLAWLIRPRRAGSLLPLQVATAASGSWPGPLCFTSVAKCLWGLFALNLRALGERKPCLAGVYCLKWALTVQGKACVDKCTKSSCKTKNAGLNKEVDELIFFPRLGLFVWTCGPDKKRFLLHLVTILSLLLSI